MNVQHATYRLMCKSADGPVAGSTGNGHRDVDLTYTDLAKVFSESD
jgi:hypothetical protein